MLCSFSLQLIFCSEQPFYGNYSTSDSHTNTVISHTFAYSSNFDADGNENVKKTIGFISKTTTLHVHHAFLRHDFDINMPNFAFYGRRKQATTKFYFFYCTWIWCLGIQLQAAVVQKVDSAIHRINLYPVDSVIGFPNTYPLDGDLFG